MNRSQRRAAEREVARSQRASRSLLAVGSAAVLASTGAGAVGLLDAPAGASVGTTFVVNSLNDNTDGTCDATHCSLREAITAANATGGQDTITFSVTGTISLSSDLPAITEAVHVNGPGYASLTVSGSTGARAFFVDHVSSGTLEFTDLTIQDCAGDYGSGALYLYGTSVDALVEDMVVQDNVSAGDGGALTITQATGTITVNRSSLLYNTADFGGGALYARGPISGPASGLTLLVSNTIFRHNHAQQNGGGLYLGDLSATITESIVADNQVDNPSAYYTYRGGGIYIDRADVTIVSSTIADNTADGSGGGIFAYWYYAGSDFVDLEIDNSTIAGNSAGIAGGIRSSGRVRTVINQSTITGNDAFYGGSPAVQVDGTGPTITNVISGSILVGNRANVPGSPEASDLGPTSSADLDVHSSLIGSYSNYFNDLYLDPGTQTGVTLASLNLGTLGDNGGPTPTISLGAGSIAIDAGPDPVATFTGNSYDQRGTGYPRVNGGRVDVGAFEAVSGPPPPTAVLVTPPGPGSRDATVRWTAPASGATPTGYQIRCLPVGWPTDIGPGGKVVYAASTSTSVVVRGLTGNTSYVCYVRARYGPDYFSSLGDADEGPLSDGSSPFLVAATAPPVPEQVRATDPPQPDGRSTAVSFVEPENRSGAPVTRYDARCTSGDGGTTRTGTGATSPLAVTGLSVGRTYACVVSAVNSVGPSAPSAASNRIVVPAGPVTAVRASAPTASNRRTTVSFTPPVGGPVPQRYWVECRTADGASVLTAGGARSPVTVTGLVRGKTYTCRVWAIFAGGAHGPVSSPSAPITVP